MDDPDEHLPTEIFKLSENSELRIEIGEARCYVTVTAGTAEVFGAVVQAHRRVGLQNTKLAFFTYEGCTIKLEGFPVEPACALDVLCDLSTLVAMSLQLCLRMVGTDLSAYIINNLRKAARDVKPGPVVAVVGPHDSGKSSLCKILLNYAIRSGWNPLLVEADVRNGMITVPGTLSAVQVEVPIEPDEGMLADAPIVLFYGHTDPAYNADLYKAQVTRLAAFCKEREKAYQGKFQNLAAGTIINTMGWVDGPGKDVQAHLCRAFDADVILVIGDDKLHSAMQMTFQGAQGVQVVKVPKSGGTVQLSREQHKASRDAAIKTYFMGASGELTPSLQQLKISQLKVFKVAGSLGAQGGLLPAGMAAAVDATRLTPVDVSDELVGHVLAACYTDEAAHIAVTNVAGFVWVQHVDFNDDSISIMCPHDSAPPKSCFILGSIKRNLDLVAQ